jgi:hypothetical protein
MTVLIIFPPEGSDLAVIIAPIPQNYLVNERMNFTRFTPMEAAPDTTAVEDDFIEASIEAATLGPHGDESPCGTRGDGLSDALVSGAGVDCTAIHLLMTSQNQRAKFWAAMLLDDGRFALPDISN